MKTQNLFRHLLLSVSGSHARVREEHLADRKGPSYSLDGASESMEPEFRGRDTFSYKLKCMWFLSLECKSSHSRSLGSKDTQSYKIRPLC